MSLNMRRHSQVSLSGDTHEALQDIDPATKFLYTPHTLTGLIALIAALLYFSGALDASQGSSLEDNIRSGLLGAIGVFLCKPLFSSIIQSLFEEAMTCMFKF